MGTPQYKRRSGGGRQRRIVVRAIRREQPDLRKLSRALIELALEQAAAEAAAEAQSRNGVDEGPANSGAVDG